MKKNKNKKKLDKLPLPQSYTKCPNCTLKTVKIEENGEIYYYCDDCRLYINYIKIVKDYYNRKQKKQKERLEKLKYEKEKKENKEKNKKLGREIRGNFKTISSPKEFLKTKGDLY